MQEKSNSNQPTSEPWYWRILDGFFLTQNSTFDILLKIGAVIVIAWLVRGEVTEWRNLYASSNESIVNGCVLPGHLLTKTQLPALPRKPEGELSHAMEREWFLESFTVWQTWGVNMVANNHEVVRLCR